jgi:hypothetical protein
MDLKYNLQKDNKIKTYIIFNKKKRILDDIMTLIEDINNINIYTNSLDDVTDYIYRIITNSKFLCEGLNPDYVVDSFNEADAVIIIGSSNDILPNGNIYGFASIIFDEVKNQIYIDVICSHTGTKGGGDILIKQIENICKNVLMDKIYLTSVKSAIPFYKKYGFIKKKESCDNMCLMVKDIIEENDITKTIGGKKSIKNKYKKSKIYKNKTVKNKRRFKPVKF